MATSRTVHDDILGAETVEEHLKVGYTPPLLEQMIELDEVGLFVSTADDDVVAYMSCGMTDATGFGDLDLYVHPDYWGEGTGTELLHRGEQHLHDQSGGKSATRCWQTTRSATRSPRSLRESRPADRNGRRTGASGERVRAAMVTSVRHRPAETCELTAHR